MSNHRLPHRCQADDVSRRPFPLPAGHADAPLCDGGAPLCRYRRLQSAHFQRDEALPSAQCRDCQCNNAVSRWRGLPASWCRRRGIVQGFHFRKHRRQIFKRVCLQPLPQRLVFRHLRQAHTFQIRLHIKTRSATHNGLIAPLAYFCNRLVAVAQILIEVVFISGRTDVNQMIRNRAILFQIFPCSDIHASVQLARVGAYNLAAYPLCQSHGLMGFSRRCRSYNRYQFHLVNFLLNQALHILIPRSAQGKKSQILIKSRQ